MKASERKYAIGEKELMAIVFAMEHYNANLYGKEFVVRTDHRPLQLLKDLKKPFDSVGAMAYYDSFHSRSSLLAGY